MLEILSDLARELKVLTVFRLCPGSLLLVSDPVGSPVVVVVTGVATGLLGPVYWLLAQAGPGSHQIAVTQVTTSVAFTGGEYLVKNKYQPEGPNTMQVKMSHSSLNSLKSGFCHKKGGVIRVQKCFLKSFWSFLMVFLWP